MRILIFCLLSFLIAFGSSAKTLEQKKKELKKIFEAGGISKLEYDKANRYLKKSEEDKIKSEQAKKTFKNKKKNLKIKSLFNNEKEPIFEEDLVKLEIYDVKKFQDEFLTYPPEVIKYFGKNSNVVGRGKKAGKFMSREFSRSEEGQQRFPGRMIKAMAFFEIFYIDSLRKDKKALKRYKEKKDLKYLLKDTDEKKIRSLIALNKGREKMRKALGMDLDTPRSEAIKKFWYLGDFLNLGKSLKNAEYDPNLKKRKELLIEYKKKITLLKEKIQTEKKKESIN